MQEVFFHEVDHRSEGIQLNRGIKIERSHYHVSGIPIIEFGRDTDLAIQFVKGTAAGRAFNYTRLNARLLNMLIGEFTVLLGMLVKSLPGRSHMAIGNVPAALENFKIKIDIITKNW